ncbi:MAG: nuclear transport factor 2 family protein [Candidatus Limnocylindrales bacterium]
MTLIDRAVATSTKAAESDVNALIDAFSEAVHARDLASSLRLLAEADDIAVIPSEGVDIHRGPASVRAFFERIYNRPQRYGWRWDDRWISFESGVASFVLVGSETVEEATDSHIVPYCMTGVAVLTSTGWRLRLLHGSEAQQT